MKKLKYLIAIPLVGSLLFSCSSGEIKEENTATNETNEVAAPVKKTPETIEDFIESIKKDKKWMAKIEEKAETKGISVEEALRGDAEWMYNKKMKDSPEAQIEIIVNKIKRDSSWSNRVRLKAEERGISFEEMIYLDAEYAYHKQGENK